MPHNPVHYSSEACTALGQALYANSSLHTLALGLIAEDGVQDVAQELFLKPTISTVKLRGCFPAEEVAGLVHGNAFKRCIHLQTPLTKTAVEQVGVVERKGVQVQGVRRASFLCLAFDVRFFD